jgi:NTE family protein
MMAEMREATETKRALVLGGGGPVGRAWQSGLLLGLIEEGVMLRSANLILGTSAGAIVGAQLGLGLDLSLVQAPPGQSVSSPRPSNGFGQLRKAMAGAALSSAPEIQRQEIGRIGLDAATVSEEQSIQRLNFLAKREWPANVQFTAVNASTGESIVWHRGSGIPLELGVASSCALPGVWPPITIHGKPYMDGGVRSMLNADLATGYTTVIVVSCFALVLPEGFVNPEQEVLNASLEAEITGLREHGAKVILITPSAELLDLTRQGTKMLDTTLVPEAYQVGNRQGVQEAARIDVSWRQI